MRIATENLKTEYHPNDSVQYDVLIAALLEGRAKERRWLNNGAVMKDEVTQWEMNREAEHLRNKISQITSMLKQKGMLRPDARTGRNYNESQVVQKVASLLGLKHSDVPRVVSRYEQIAAAKRGQK